MAEQDVWAPSETPIRDEVSLLLDMDPDHPIHCDWCGLFVTYQIGFDDSVPTFCYDCESEWLEEVDEIDRHNSLESTMADTTYPPLLVADTSKIGVLWPDGSTVFIGRNDMKVLHGDLRLQGVVTRRYLPHYMTQGDVERIERLFTNMDLGTAPPRCHCRAVMPCDNHPF